MIEKCCTCGGAIITIGPVGVQLSEVKCLYCGRHNIEKEEELNQIYYTERWRKLKERLHE